MPRARRKPAALVALGDIGPETPAAMAGTVVHMVAEAGRAPTRRKFRDHPIDEMRKRGLISQAQHNAATIALNLYERTQTGGGELREAVDGGASPDTGTVIRCDAIRAYARAAEGIPWRWLPVYRWIVEQGQPLRMYGPARASSTEALRQLRLFRMALDNLRV